MPITNYNYLSLVTLPRCAETETSALIWHILKNLNKDCQIVQTTSYLQIVETQERSAENPLLMKKQTTNLERKKLPKKLFPALTRYPLSNKLVSHKPSVPRDLLRGRTKVLRVGDYGLDVWEGRTPGYFPLNLGLRGYCLGLPVNVKLAELAPSDL